LHHRGTPDEETRYVDAAKKIVDQQARVFGALPEFDNGEYTFLSVYLPWASGDGMEHRNSTSLTNTGSLARSMNGLLGTVSHEFFHAWNVERMRPATLEPFDFTEANMSDGLWLAEGFTNYYGPLTMRRAGITSVGAFLAGAGGAANAVVNAPGRRFHSPIQMSQQAPFVDAAVSIDPQNKPNTFLSYYTYGQAVALALDLTLRGRSPSVTLDDFMREMWKRHGAQRGYAPVKPYTMSDVRSALAAVTGDAAFARDFFARYIDGREAPPYAELVARAGLVFRQADTTTPFIGAIDLAFDSTGGRVTSNTIAGSPIYQAGVDRGDVLVSLGGIEIKSRQAFDQAVKGLKPNERTTIVFHSRGQQVTSELTVGTNPRMELVPIESTGGQLTPAMQAFRDAWLGQP
jgi:predicted metalloprotease with PDZ domain